MGWRKVGDPDLGVCLPLPLASLWSEIYVAGRAMAKGEEASKCLPFTNSRRERDVRVCVCVSREGMSSDNQPHFLVTS